MAAPSIPLTRDGSSSRRRGDLDVIKLVGEAESNLTSPGAAADPPWIEIPAIGPGKYSVDKA
jgi:hypothetical protein